MPLTWSNLGPAAIDCCSGRITLEGHDQYTQFVFSLFDCDVTFTAIQHLIFVRLTLDCDVTDLAFNTIRLLPVTCSMWRIPLFNLLMKTLLSRAYRLCDNYWVVCAVICCMLYFYLAITNDYVGAQTTRAAPAPAPDHPPPLQEWH